MIDREELIKSLNLKGIGIEIGVQKGKFANTILNQSSLYLYLVDAWRKFEDAEYIDPANVSTEKHLERMLITIKTLEKHEGRFTIIRDTSEGASKIFRNEFFDFIYIDANHSYKECIKDLELWFPKLKKGGIIAGHDYINRLPTFEVKKAVDEFFGKMGMEVKSTQGGKFPSFYVNT